MLKHLVWLCFISIAAGACGEAASGNADGAVTVKRQTGSFVEDYIAAQQGVKPAPAIDVAGDWRGVLFCPSGAFPLDFAVEQNGAEIGGVATIDTAIGDARRTTPFHVDHRGRAGTGEYGAAHQTLIWESPAPPGADSRTTRGLVLRMMLAPEDRNAALVAAFELAGTRARRECQGVALRGAGVEKINAFIENSAAIRADRRPVVQGDCPAAYKAWLDDGLSGEDAFAEPAFSSVFGNPFKDMAAEPLLQASAVISGSCTGDVDRSQWIAAMRQAAALRNYKAYDSANETYFRTRIFDEWRSWIDAELLRGAPIDQTAAVSIRSAPHIFNWRGHPEFRAFDERIATVIDAGGDANRNLDFARNIEHAKDDFRTLVNMRLEAESLGDIDMDMVAVGLDYYLADAAATYAEQSETPRAAVYMAAWIEQQEANGVCPAASASVCKKAVDAFQRKVGALAVTYAKQEAEAFNALAKDTRGTDGLASLVAFERDLRLKYAGLLSLAPFEKSAPKRAQKRQALQKKHARDIRREVEASTTAPQIRALEARYFINDEIDAGAVKQVKAALGKALAGTTPFAGIAGADYFNALYNQDFAALRALDREYMEGIRPLMTFSAQQAIKMGPLIDALSGRRQGTTAGEIAYGVQNMSALYAALGAYLVNYDRRYEQCLKPGATTIEISQRTDIVTRDGLGYEIRRVEGWTNRDYYRVNPEFSGHFNTLFNAATGTAQAQLLDLFLNDAKVTSLRQGADRLMANHDCASPEVKQLEAGFLAYDRELRKR